MAEIAVINASKKEVGKVDLPDAAYDYPCKRHLLYEAVHHYLACARRGTHKVKNRIEVSGGGRKPWRQKGTGRSRHGSIRSPLWRSGGIVHGPQPRSYAYRFPKKARRRALASALSEKLRRGELVVVDGWDGIDTPKTKALAGLVRSGEERVRVLVVGDGRDRADLETEVASLGIGDFVHFAGFRSDIPGLLAQTDLLCMPSITEGLPYTALEAGRQAVPLLLSRVGGPERIFTEDETAAFVPPADAKALEVGIAALLDDPEKRQRLGTAAQDLVATRFSVDRMNGETLAHYSAGSGVAHA